MPDPRRLRLLLQEQSQVHASGFVRQHPRQSLVHVRAHFITLATHGRTEMDVELRSGNAAPQEMTHALLENVSLGAAPAGVEQGDRSRRMSDEYRHAVGNRDGERGAPLEHDVPVCVVNAQPSVPRTAMHHDAVPVDLSGVREARTA